MISRTVVHDTAAYLRCIYGSFGIEIAHCNDDDGVAMMVADNRIVLWTGSHQAQKVMIVPLIIVRVRQSHRLHLGPYCPLESPKKSLDPPGVDYSRVSEQRIIGEISSTYTRDIQIALLCSVIFLETRRI